MWVSRKFRLIVLEFGEGIGPINTSTYIFMLSKTDCKSHLLPSTKQTSSQILSVSERISILNYTQKYSDFIISRVIETMIDKE